MNDQKQLYIIPILILVGILIPALITTRLNALVKKNDDITNILSYPKVHKRNQVNKVFQDSSFESITNTSEVEIFPIYGSKKATALQSLELYLLNYVGVIPKYSQREFEVNSFFAAEAIYRPFKSEGKVWNRIYSIVKNQNRTLIITQGFYLDESISLTESTLYKDYQDFLNNLDFEKYFQSKTKNVLPESYKGSREWIDEYKENNNKFPTSF